MRECAPSFVWTGHTAPGKADTQTLEWQQLPHSEPGNLQRGECAAGKGKGIFLGDIKNSIPTTYIAIMSKLFVYGVNAQCPRETLEDEFSKYGEVVDVYNTGKGFAFVTFADERNASEAIRGMNGQVIGK